MFKVVGMISPLILRTENPLLPYLLEIATKREFYQNLLRQSVLAQPLTLLDGSGGCTLK